MVQPEFLAALRRQYNCQDLLLMIQLEQVFPGFWINFNELSEQLGCERATLYRGIKRLRERGLLCYTTISNNGGVWVWWVKQNEQDSPNPDNEPAYVVLDCAQHKKFRIKINQRYEWAKCNGIPRQTMRSWLMGSSEMLRKRWRLISAPIDY